MLKSRAFEYLNLVIDVLEPNLDFLLLFLGSIVPGIGYEAAALIGSAEGEHLPPCHLTIK
jgi:hypothetical protein